MSAILTVKGAQCVSLSLEDFELALAGSFDQANSLLDREDSLSLSSFAPISFEMPSVEEREQAEIQPEAQIAPTTEEQFLLNLIILRHWSVITLQFVRRLNP